MNFKSCEEKHTWARVATLGTIGQDGICNVTKCDNCLALQVVFESFDDEFGKRNSITKIVEPK